MGNHYPQTIRINPQPTPELPPYVRWPANDNRPGGIPLGYPTPANDNFPRVDTRTVRRWIKRTRFSDARLQLILEGISMTWDYLDPNVEPTYTEYEGKPEGYSTVGWNMYANYGRVPHFNVPGFASGQAWPNFTQGTTYNYPYALSGYGGYGMLDTSYVSEFFQPPGFNPNIAAGTKRSFSAWHYHMIDNAGMDYWRISSSQTWVEDGVSNAPYPVWRVAEQPYTVPWGIPNYKPLYRQRLELSTRTHDVFGNELRGPAPRPRTEPVRYPERPRPPPPDTKEKKLKGAIRIISSAFEGATEIVDLIAAIYDALPQGLRDALKLSNDYGDLVARIDAIWKNYHLIDTRRMLENILIETGQDRYYGNIHGAISEARRNLKIVTGPVVTGAY